MMQRNGWLTSAQRYGCRHGAAAWQPSCSCLWQAATQAALQQALEVGRSHKIGCFIIRRAAHCSHTWHATMLRQPMQGETHMSCCRLLCTSSHKECGTSLQAAGSWLHAQQGQVLIPVSLTFCPDMQWPGQFLRAPHRGATWQQKAAGQHSSGQPIQTPAAAAAASRMQVGTAAVMVPQSLVTNS
jgi:hypothetical protein